MKYEDAVIAKVLRDVRDNPKRHFEPDIRGATLNCVISAYIVERHGDEYFDVEAFKKASAFET